MPPRFGGLGGGGASSLAPQAAPRWRDPYMKHWPTIVFKLAQIYVKTAQNANIASEVSKSVHIASKTLKTTPKYVKTALRAPKARAKNFAQNWPPLEFFSGGGGAPPSLARPLHETLWWFPLWLYIPTLNSSRQYLTRSRQLHALFQLLNRREILWISFRCMVTPARNCKIVSLFLVQTKALCCTLVPLRSTWWGQNC